MKYGFVARKSKMDQAQTTIKDLELQVQSLQSQLRESHSVSEELGRLEQAISRMYLEFADRASSAMQKQVPETFEQLLEESPLVVLDRLRAQLRILLAFREDFESQLQCDAAQTAQTTSTQRKSMESKLLEAEDRIFELKQELSRAKSDISAYEQQLTDAQRAAQADSASIRKRLETLEGQKSRQVEEIARQKAKIERSNQLMKNQDLKLARISELEAKLQQKETEFQSRIAKVQTLDRNEIIRLQREIANFKRVETENAQLKQTARQLGAELASYRSNVKTVKYADACEQIERLQALESQLRSQLEETRAELSATENDKIYAEQALKQAQAQIKAFEEEAEKQLKIQPIQKTTAAEIRALPEQQKQQVLAQHELQTAMDKLKERDREIEELAKRVRKLLALQHKTALSQKAFLEEKQQLERQIEQLRDENAALRKAQGARGQTTGGFRTAASMSATQPTGAGAHGNAHDASQRAQEELLRDVQNLRAYAITASASEARETRHSQQPLAQLDEILDQESWLRSRYVNSNLREGRGGGYGAGSMLGTRVRSAGFGVQ